ncbi:MAG: Calx-beta domain-containing protein, partial [Gammaproteobacteria bacterium]
GVSFDIATTDGTATVADNDYVARSLTGQTIAAGASTFTFDVTVNGDLFVEPNENFVVQVSNLVGAAPSDTGATGFIDSDDFAPALTVADVVVIEGNAGTVNAQFTVSLGTPAPPGGVSFDIATTDGTATVADNDYVARSLTGQTIAAGASTFTFDVTVNGDNNIEPNENFVVQVSNLVGAAPSDTGATGFIDNDDAAPNLSIDDVTVTEGNAGTTTASFTVSLSNPAPAGGVSFDIATADGSATVADNDYVARSLTGQTIAAGASSFAFDVTINGDTVFEANETFNVDVGNVTGATVVDGQGVGTITNDDTSSDLSVTVSVAPNPVIPGDALTYTVNGNNAGPDAASNAQVSLSFATAFASLSGPAGWSCSTPAIGAAGTVTCNIASLPVGAFSFTVQATVPFGTAPGDLSATASIGADNSDPTPANNASTTVVTVVAGPSLPVVPVPVLHGQLALWLAALFMGLGLVAVARRGS